MNDSLTDEELAADADFIKAVIWQGGPDDDSAVAERALNRLIAALRASRAEVERLRACMQMVMDDGHTTAPAGCLTCAAVERYLGGDDAHKRLSGTPDA